MPTLTPWHGGLREHLAPRTSGSANSGLLPVSSLRVSARGRNRVAFVVGSRPWHVALLPSHRMPGGAEHPLIGSLMFTAVKFGGYAFAGHVLNKRSSKVVSPFRVGALRTLIGITFGAAVWGFTGLVDSPALTSTAYVVLLAPIRLLEWWLLVRFVYGPNLKLDGKAYALLVLLSYLLDVPAVVGLFVTGGFWIC